MKRILLVHLPFCTPVSPPYALANLYSFLKNNSFHSVNVLDLNLEFHKMKFGLAGNYFRKGNWDDYKTFSNDYINSARGVYANNNKKIREGREPEFFKELLEKIIMFNPDVVAFSLIYSSQVFYAHALIKKLKNQVVVVGGPAVNSKLKTVAGKHLNNEVEFLQAFGEDVDHPKLNRDYAVDYSKFDLDSYFCPQVVLPLKTSTACFHKRCTFCDHYAKVPYLEYDLEQIRKTAVNSQAKFFFLIDDMIPVNRLIKLSEIFSQAGAKFGCQLRPRKEFTSEKLQILAKNGLDFVIWGVESGNDRVLKKMKKDTNVVEVEKVLKFSNQAGIRNIVYVMFGFPTETKDEFRDTIQFLKRNADNITLVSPSVFGLQKGTPIYLNPNDYGITKIIEKKRELLEDQISYKAGCGLSNDEVLDLKKKYKKSIEGVNKVPKTMNFFREHVFFI